MGYGAVIGRRGDEVALADARHGSRVQTNLYRKRNDPGTYPYNIHAHTLTMLHTHYGEKVIAPSS